MMDAGFQGISRRNLLRAAFGGAFAASGANPIERVAAIQEGMKAKLSEDVDVRQLMVNPGAPDPHNRITGHLAKGTIVEIPNTMPNSVHITNGDHTISGWVPNDSKLFLPLGAPAPSTTFAQNGFPVTVNREQWKNAPTAMIIIPNQQSKLHLYTGPGSLAEGDVKSAWPQKGNSATVGGETVDVEPSQRVAIIGNMTMPNGKDYSEVATLYKGQFVTGIMEVSGNAKPIDFGASLGDQGSLRAALTNSQAPKPTAMPGPKL